MNIWFPIHPISMKITEIHGITTIHQVTQIFLARFMENL